MSRPSKETQDPSDAEKGDLIALIRQGKTLPKKYRFVLVEDKREADHLLAAHVDTAPVKVTDIFGNDTMTPVPVNVG